MGSVPLLSMLSLMLDEAVPTEPRKTPPRSFGFAEGRLEGPPGPSGRKSGPPGPLFPEINKVHFNMHPSQ